MHPAPYVVRVFGKLVLIVYESMSKFPRRDCSSSLSSFELFKNSSFKCSGISRLLQFSAVASLDWVAFTDTSSSGSIGS